MIPVRRQTTRIEEKLLAFAEKKKWPEADGRSGQHFWEVEEMPPLDATHSSNRKPPKKPIWGRSKSAVSSFSSMFSQIKKQGQIISHYQRHSPKPIEFCNLSHPACCILIKLEFIFFQSDMCFHLWECIDCGILKSNHAWWNNFFLSRLTAASTMPVKSCPKVLVIP